MDIDLEAKCRDLNLTKEIYLRILKKAFGQTEGDLIELEGAVAKDDFAKVAAVSHRLKGDYGNLRLEELSSLAKEVNELAKEGIQKEKIRELLDCFKGSFAKLQNLIGNQIE